MNQSSYNTIATWYDRSLDENPLYRENLLPHLIALIEDVHGQHVCDLACGQGWIARELAQRGAQVTGVDVATTLLDLARQQEEQQPLGILYLQDDAQYALGLPDRSFDGCVCTMALMTIPDLQAVFQTIRRILLPGGWLVFAITHPCFEVPHASWITKDNGGRAWAVNGYFHERFWMSSLSDDVRSLMGDYHRMLSTYLNTLVASRLAFEHMIEPAASSKRAEEVSRKQEVPSLLLIRARAV